MIQGKMLSISLKKWTPSVLPQWEENNVKEGNTATQKGFFLGSNLTESFVKDKMSRVQNKNQTKKNRNASWARIGEIPYYSTRLHGRGRWERVLDKISVGHIE